MPPGLAAQGLGGDIGNFIDEGIETAANIADIFSFFGRRLLQTGKALATYVCPVGTC